MPPGRTRIVNRRKRRIVDSRVVRVVLESAGFQVMEAVDGREAVETFEKHQQKIDLVMLDVTMPRLDGISALEKIRAIAPDIPAILCSGMGAESPASAGEHTGFVAKPFAPDEVLQLVRELPDAA